jgi:hypothetical protein
MYCFFVNLFRKLFCFICFYFFWDISSSQLGARLSYELRHPWKRTAMLACPSPTSPLMEPD